MKTRIITTLLLGLFAMTMLAEEKKVDIRRNEVHAHGGTRSVQPYVLASYNESHVSVSINNYAGESIIYVCNEYGETVSMESLYISGHATSSSDISSLQEGLYYIYIQLGDISFYGEINK